MVAIMLVDDHPVVRQGLKNILVTVRDFRIIGEASNGAEAVSLSSRLKPDVIMLDLMMKGMNGIEATRQITKNLKKVGIIIFSMLGNENYVIDALRAGAMGYVLKDAPSEELLQAVRQVAAGKKFLGTPINEDFHLRGSIDDIPNSCVQLTLREREILRLLVQGSSCAEAAHQLNISRRTVEAHRANMMHKLGLPSSTALYRYALQKDNLINSCA